MINLNFDSYSEIDLQNFQLVDTYTLQHWIHCNVTFSCDRVPPDLLDPQALVILNQDYEVLQIILQEEGCDSPNYQFTEKEKQLIAEWIGKQKIEVE